MFNSTEKIIDKDNMVATLSKSSRLSSLLNSLKNSFIFNIRKIINEVNIISKLFFKSNFIPITKCKIKKGNIETISTAKFKKLNFFSII